MSSNREPKRLGSRSGLSDRTLSTAISRMPDRVGRPPFDQAIQMPRCLLDLVFHDAWLVNRSCP
jgi:hypothetical protein